MTVFRKAAQAEEDLIDIWLYIAQDNPGAANQLLDTFEEKGQLLAANPKLGQARPDIAEDFRYLPVGRYLMLYRVITDGIELVRVVQGMRLLSTIQVYGNCQGNCRLDGLTHAAFSNVPGVLVGARAGAVAHGAVDLSGSRPVLDF